MSSVHDDSTISDHAMFLALRAWSGTASPAFWESFRPGWSDSLRHLWENFPVAAQRDAYEDLKGEHSAEVRPDFSRVHPSWWVRALQQESKAVQRTVAMAAPAAIREVLCAELGLPAEELMPARQPPQEIRQQVLSLWSERLVGDFARRRDDPPVITALTGFDRRETHRLIRTAGLAKWSLILATPPPLPNRDRERFDHFQRFFDEPSPRLKQLAKHDAAHHGPTGRHEIGRLGLVTVARLLEVVEPYRVRWALQHVPYPIAKFIRTLMNPKARRESSLAVWETEILRAAWSRLYEEGKLTEDFGGSS